MAKGKSRKTSNGSPNGATLCFAFVLWVAATFAVLSMMVMGELGAADDHGSSLPKGFVEFPTRQKAPEIALQDGKGVLVSLDEFKTKVLVLNFWATWCVPCVKELPALDRLALALPPDRFAIIAATEDAGGILAAKPFLDKLEIRHLIVLADLRGKAQRAFSVRGLPTTFLIIPDGSVFGRVEGPIDWDSRETKEFLLSFR